MVWAIDLDDFTGTFCKQGKYPLITTLKNALGLQSNSKWQGFLEGDPPAHCWWRASEARELSLLRPWWILLFFGSHSKRLCWKHPITLDPQG